MFRRILTFTLIFVFIGSSVPVPKARAAQLPLPLPTPGQMVPLSPAFTPAHLVGITIHPENALQFDFLIHKGDQPLDRTKKSEEYKNLVKYFLASLTVPDQDQWVNLSPYEKDRIIKQDFGQTEMGRDLLAQDYILKQITASLINPQEALGRQFWDRVYAQAHQQFGTTAIPVNTFNKVWVVPDSALVYEKGDSAYILQSHLKVMLEEDYLALEKHQKGVSYELGAMGQFAHSPQPITHSIASQVVRELVIPALEREVNTGKNFAQLRQIYSGMILATWYKKALKDSLLGKIYADKDKVKGVDQNPKNNAIIYQQYLKAFKKGVFNFIKEDVDKYTNQPIPRKYFSGGFHNTLADGAMTVVRKISVDFKLDESWKVDEIEQATVDLRGDQEPGIPIGSNTVAMTTTGMKGWDLFQNLLQRQWNPLTVRLTVGQKTYYVKATKNNFVQIKSLFLDEKLQIINGRGVGRLIAVDGHLPENLDVVEIPTGSQAVNLFENLLNKNSAPGSVKMIIGAEQRVVKGTSMNFNLIKEYLDPTTNAPAQLGFSNSGSFIGLVALNDTAPKGIEFADTAMTATPSEGGGGKVSRLVKPEDRIVGQEFKLGDEIYFSLHDRSLRGVILRREKLVIPITLEWKGQGPVEVLANSKDYWLTSQEQDVYPGIKLQFNSYTKLTRIRNVSDVTYTIQITQAVDRAMTAEKYLEVGISGKDVAKEVGILATFLRPMETTEGEAWENLHRLFDRLNEKDGIRWEELTAGGHYNFIHIDEKDLVAVTRQELWDYITERINTPREIPISLTASQEFIPMDHTALGIGVSRLQRIQNAFSRWYGNAASGMTWLLKKAGLLSILLAGDLTLSSLGNNFMNTNQSSNISAQPDYGGIDFNAVNLNLQIKRDGNGVPLPLVQQDMNQLMQINGFVPVIIEIQPVMNLPFLSQSQT